ncbi:hypothetical protein FUAX_52780 (plasmid) [Fulvitalea axinellae]|uniref:Uncharacterized protein n=1 Tax=Fulvitalea axinellae TaxID=1182444 RepID=A0AAU9CLG6_9BACT|nr:hypothetical protein FUAX_52780 [Fulvitalea axinellae]
MKSRIHIIGLLGLFFSLFCLDGVWAQTQIDGSPLYHKDGKVGVGTSSPQYNLHVNGTFRANRLVLEDSIKARYGLHMIAEKGVQLGYGREDIGFVLKNMIRNKSASFKVLDDRLHINYPGSGLDLRGDNNFVVHANTWVRDTAFWVGHSKNLGVRFASGGIPVIETKGGMQIVTDNTHWGLVVRKKDISNKAHLYVNAEGIGLSNQLYGGIFHRISDGKVVTGTGLVSPTVEGHYGNVILQNNLKVEEDKISAQSKVSAPGLTVTSNGRIDWGWEGRSIDLYDPESGSTVMRFRNSMGTGAGNPKGGFSFATNDGRSMVRIINNSMGIGTETPGAKMHIVGPVGKGLRVSKEHVDPENRYLNIWQGNTGGVIDAVGTGELYLGFDNNLNVGLAGKGGKVRVGSLDFGGDALMAVAGTLEAKEIKVKIDAGGVVPDYVFKPDYGLRSLRDIEDFIRKEGHLPEIPSEKEILEAGGVETGDFQMRLLKKIEELTLYAIEQEKKIKKQHTVIQNMEKDRERIDRLEKLVLELTERKSK